MSKIKKYQELSNDIEDLSLEDQVEKLKGEYQIEEILDIFMDPKDIPVTENVIIGGSNLTDKNVKRGDYLYITCLMRKEGTSLNSPATQHTIKVRIVDIFYGLAYLNKILK